MPAKTQVLLLLLLWPVLQTPPQDEVVFPCLVEHSTGLILQQEDERGVAVITMMGTSAANAMCDSIMSMALGVLAMRIGMRETGCAATEARKIGVKRLGA